MQQSTGFRIGVDIGGTFTDIVAARGHQVVDVVKLPSTPSDFSIAIADGLRQLVSRGVPVDAIETVIHGTTVATNAILEGKGAPTALLTTKGFRDVLELRRIRVPELYNFEYVKPPPLVRRRDRLEVAERVAADGSVLIRPSVDEIDRALSHVNRHQIRALAICFLNSYANDEHERLVADRARAVLGRDVYVTASCEILPEIREYERTSTTVVNAYVGPLVRGYLEKLVAVLEGIGIRAPLKIMQSNGGTLPLDSVLRVPAAIVESGPAAGVIAGLRVASHAPGANAITLDMGGTTAKAALIEDGQLSRTTEYEVGAGINVSSQLVKGRGHALRLPVIDVSEIGAGGGSIAVVNSLGRLSVGPESAGAVPGPVAYGKGGTTATLTDALITLGYLSGTSLAGGSVPVDGAAARKAVEEQIARPLGSAVHVAARGVYLLAAAVMTRAVKAVTTFRGRDPRDCTLIAFGGNGALMAPQIANDLEIARIVVPALPGVFSACGLVVAADERELVRTLFQPLANVSSEGLLEQLRVLAATAVQELVAAGCPEEDIEVDRTADLRYRGQAYELMISIPLGELGPGLVSYLDGCFHREHERTFGHSSPGAAVDLVSIRVVARHHPRFRDLPTFDYDRLPAAGAIAVRRAYFGDDPGFRDTPVLSRSQLRKGGEMPGPLIIEEYDATAIVPPGWRARIEASSILLRRESV